MNNVNKKLIVDARMYNHSGIGTYLQMLLPFMVTQYDVTLLGDPATLSSLASFATIIPFQSPIYSIHEQRHFGKLIGPADLFWSPHYNVPLMGIKCSKRVVTIHDVFHLAFSGQLSFNQRLYAKLVFNRAVRSSDTIITVSDFSKSEISKFTKCRPEKISVVYNGVNQEVSLSDKKVVVDKYKLPDKYILFVGNVKPHKNLTTLLKAFLLLDNKILNEYKVVIAGKKDGFLSGDKELINWVNNTPQLKEKVVFTGYIDHADMDNIYANASLFVFPSIYEGFGLPPLESMLNRCPVIASNTSSMPEVCGPAVLYVNPLDEADICNKITKVLTTKSVSAQLVENGLERIKLFTWQNSAEAHIRIFNQLMEN